MKKIAIVGGGVAGMACAVLLQRRGIAVTLLERGARLGRKLAATGNGQGNVTNVNVSPEHYFTDDRDKLSRILSNVPCERVIRFLESMGGVFLPDSRGRVYPASRQASAVTDLFRRELTCAGTDIRLNTQVTRLTHERDFVLEWEGGHMRADAVVLAAGGKAAKNFGTDGTAYALAEGFGHTVTELAPVLVQLRSDPAAVRGLKGVRADALVTLSRGGRHVTECRGDILFTESGISGDAAFRLSSYAKKGDTVSVDFLPDISFDRLSAAAGEGEDGLLCLVNNAVARVLYRRARGRDELLSLVKAFPVPVTGTLGFDYAQATRGGIPLSETDDALMSKKQEGLYFAGEILNVDGECGGYNLHFAFASAITVSEAIG